MTEPAPGKARTFFNSVRVDYTDLKVYDKKGNELALKPDLYIAKTEKEQADSIKPEVKAVAAEKGAVAAWTNVPATSKYAVFEVKSGKLVKVTETKGNVYAVKNLTSGKEYKYTVRAYCGGKWTSADAKDAVSVIAK